MSKKYLLALNFLGGENYYVRCNKNSWDEVYSPEVATEFNSRKDAISWLKENTTMAEYGKPIVKEKAVKDWNDFVKNGYIRRTFDLVQKNISRKYDKNKDSPEDVIRQRILMEKNDGLVRYEDYKTWPDLHQLFECLFSIRSYYKDKGKECGEIESTFEICVRKKTDFDTFKKELQIALKFCEVERDGYKHFGIFDHFCGEGGNFACFNYKSDKDCKISTGWTDGCSGDLKKVFEFWKRERYYD